MNESLSGLDMLRARARRLREDILKIHQDQPLFAVQLLQQTTRSISLARRLNAKTLPMDLPSLMMLHLFAELGFLEVTIALKEKSNDLEP